MSEQHSARRHDIADPRVIKLLQGIHDLLKANQGKVDTTMATIQDVRDKVAAQSTVVQSVLELIRGLRQQLADAIAAGADPAALQEIVDQLAANDQLLADATVENTPAV
jgi:hypothetical protein